MSGSFCSCSPSLCGASVPTRSRFSCFATRSRCYGAKSPAPTWSQLIGRYWRRCRACCRGRGGRRSSSPRRRCCAGTVTSSPGAGPTPAGLAVQASPQKSERWCYDWRPRMRRGAIEGFTVSWSGWATGSRPARVEDPPSRRCRPRVPTQRPDLEPVPH